MTVDLGWFFPDAVENRLCVYLYLVELIALPEAMSL